MKLKVYLAALNDAVKKNPEILEFDVVCASDDEGNSFQKANFTPTIGQFDGHDFTEDVKLVNNPNAVCIN
jgi:hypothetical protein